MKSIRSSVTIDWTVKETVRAEIRTRIKRLGRKTICFSKSVQMHDLVIGMFVNRYEFGLCI